MRDGRGDQGLGEASFRKGLESVAERIGKGC